MKNFQTKFVICLIAFIGLTTVSSCDESWWIGSTDLDGQWRIVEIDGNSNYEEGDAWYFYNNGDFYAMGSGNLHEQGLWERTGRWVYISFEYVEPEIEAYIERYDTDYMVLNVRDYTYGTDYTIRLVREAYYSPKK